MILKINKTYTVEGTKDNLQKLLLKLRVYSSMDCDPETLKVGTIKANTKKTNDLIKEILNDNKDILKEV